MIGDSEFVRCHYKAQTVDRFTPGRVRVAWWVGPALCADEELRKIGEWELSADEWRALGRLVRGGDETWALLDGAEGGEWDWSRP